MRILVLDDDECRLKVFREKLIGNYVVCCTTSKETIQKLNNETWQYLFLDHDLGGQIYVDSGENTGYEVAEWLSNNPEKQPENIVIHSFNPVGAKNMKVMLPKAQVIPGAWDKLQ